MTQKEAVCAMMRGERPDVIVDGYEPFGIIFDDLLTSSPMPRPGTAVVNVWGVTEYWEEGQMGPMFSEDPEHLVCPDVTEWKKYVTKPNVVNKEIDWSNTLAQKEKAHSEGKFAVGFMPVGVFETLHAILGFEECLVDLLTEPEDTMELVETIFSYKMEVMKRHIEEWKPDGILMQDDFGSKETLLMPPDVWRAFFKEGYRKLIQYAHDHGVFIMLHSDSQNSLIAGDLEEIGLDIWQGALPTCDILGLQKSLPGNMIFMGGLDSGVFDRPGASREEIVDDVLRACQAYLPGGKFIPSVTYGLPGAFFEGVDAVISETIADLNAKRCKA